MSEKNIQIQSILVPLDGSVVSEKALPWAVEMATQHQAEVILLRVGRDPDILEGEDLPSLHSFQKSQEAKCRSYLGKIKEALPLPRVRIEYAAGIASQIIPEKARQLAVSLVIMNSHGRDGMSRWWMGSVAERVTRRSPCPVLLVRDGPAGKQI